VFTLYRIISSGGVLFDPYLFGWPTWCNRSGERRGLSPPPG